MFRSYSYTTIREHINSCLLKLQLLKQSIKIYRCVVNTVMVWLHILGFENPIITVFDTLLLITDLIYAATPPPY